MPRAELFRGRKPRWFTSIHNAERSMFAITCSNFAESLNFYREVLGFEIVVGTHTSAQIATRLGVAPRGFHQVRVADLRGVMPGTLAG